VSLVAWLTRTWYTDNLLLQPISATDLSRKSMILGPSDLHADCVGCGALPQSSHAHILLRAFGDIDAVVIGALLRRHGAVRSRRYDGMLERSGA